MKMSMKIRMRLLAAAMALFVLGCASKPGAYQDVDSAIASGDYEAALAAIEKGQASKKPVYDVKRNGILLALDKGQLEHYAGRYNDSAADLEDAELQIQDAFTKSITQEIGSYIANDNTKDYAGEEYEDIYLNVFNALNYYNTGDVEGAGVEVRKISEKIALLEDKYASLEPKERKKGSPSPEALQLFINASLLVSTTAAGISPIMVKIPPELVTPNASIKFTDSALARYLSAIIYRSEGRRDDARIDIEAIDAAVKRAPEIYSNPTSLSGELNIPNDKGRLNVIAFTGLSPVKQPERMPFDLRFFSTLGQSMPTGSIVLPKLVKRPSIIQSVKVKVGETDPVELELLENIGAAVQATFDAKYHTIYLKTWVRAAVAYASAEVTAQVSMAKASESGSVLARLGAAATIIAAVKVAEAAQAADTRSARFLPGKAYVGGINLDPGVYTITVTFDGGTTKTYNDVKVEAGKLNLVEAISLD
jgi:hypothetical protein